MPNLSSLIDLITWRDVADIATVGLMIWLAIRFVRRTRGRRALTGLMFLGAVYLTARGLGLELTTALFHGFFAALLLVVVVVFQEDLRRLFEQLGSLRRGAQREAPADGNVDALVRAVARLASTRTGALIVLPAREPLESHVEGGVALGGRVSEPILLSIFDASSPGHDGAVILRGDRIDRFAVHLPLSSNHQALGPGGTRHAAALGLAERCDATCIVVSEERGTISIARNGELKVLRRPEDLVELLRPQVGATGASRWWSEGVGLDTALAGFGAIALWVALVPGSVLTEVTVPANVRVTNLPKDLEIESIEPAEVSVTLRGLRRQLVFSDSDQVSVRIDAYLARFGRRTFAIEEDSVRRPDLLDIVSVDPDKVKLSLRPVGPGGEAAPTPAP